MCRKDTPDAVDVPNEKTVILWKPFLFLLIAGTALTVGGGLLLWFGRGGLFISQPIILCRLCLDSEPQFPDCFCADCPNDSSIPPHG